MTAEQLRAELGAIRAAASASLSQAPAHLRLIAQAGVDTIYNVAAAIVDNQAALETRISELDKQNLMTHQVLSERIRKLEHPT